MPTEENTNNGGAPANPAPTLSIPVDRGSAVATFDTGAGTKSTPSVETGLADTRSASFGMDGKVEQRATPQELDVDPDGDTEAALKGEPDGLGAEAAASTTKDPEGSGAKDAEGGTEALPDFDHASDEVVSQYDAKYLKDLPEDQGGGKVLNLEAFNDEMNSIYSKTGKPDINPQSREYLKKVFGIPDSAIDTHLAGLTAAAKEADSKVYLAAGGEDAHTAAHEWATKGGYNEAQKASYNAAMEQAQKGNLQPLLEQSELLAARFKSSGGKVASEQPNARPFGIQRRGSSPARSAGDGAATQKLTPRTPVEDSSVYANQEAHRVAQAEADASGDKTKIDAVRAKLRRSIGTW